MFLNAEPTEITENLIIWGSSRANGETFSSVQALNKTINANCFDLTKSDMSYYDYDHKNQSDDFLTISQHMISATNIIFATPVYWYSMCAPMKVFFDRLSDLLGIRKQDGRALAGKNTYLVANGTDTQLPEGFEVPFKRTSDYFDMHYKGAHFLHTGNNETLKKTTWDALHDFSQKISSASFA